MNLSIDRHPYCYLNCLCIKGNEHMFFENSCLNVEVSSVTECCLLPTVCLFKSKVQIVLIAEKHSL